MMPVQYHHRIGSFFHMGMDFVADSWTDQARNLNYEACQAPKCGAAFGGNHV